MIDQLSRMIMFWLWLHFRWIKVVFAYLYLSEATSVAHGSSALHTEDPRYTPCLVNWPVIRCNQSMALDTSFSL